MPSCPGTVPVVSTREEKAANFDQLFMHPVNVSPRKATPVTVVETDMKATLMEWLQVPGQVFNSSRAGFLIVKEQAKKGRATLIAGLSIKIEGWKEFGEALLYSFVSFLGMLVGLLWLMFHLETWWCSR